MQPAPRSDVDQLYLDLLKRALTRSGFGESRPVLTSRYRGGPRGVAAAVIARALDRGGLQLVRPVDSDARADGRDVPADAETMVGLRRLDNIQECVTDVVERGVPGDLIETGVWRGGAAIFMRAVLKVLGVTDRTVWCADSFEGLPPPDGARYPADQGDIHSQLASLAVTLDQVEANFARYGLLDGQVRFLKGWFKDTLPAAPMDEIAVLRLDGDMYESTIVALEALYPKLSVGGWVIVDDFGAVPACRAAVEDYRRAQAIEEPWSEIDWTGICWRKERRAGPG